MERSRGTARWKRWLFRGGIGFVVLFGLIQAVPYGRSHSNPPVLAEPRWDSPTTRDLALEVLGSEPFRSGDYSTSTLEVPAHWRSDSAREGGALRSVVNLLLLLLLQCDLPALAGRATPAATTTRTKLCT